MPNRSVAIVGGGIGGLACAARLAAAGCNVTLCEAAPTLGGKLRQIEVGGHLIDSGPTVLTMRWVFEDLFDACGASLAEALPMTPLAILARHFWPDGSKLDLFADRARSADAIGDFAGAPAAQGYRAFCERARRTYEALESSFIRAERPSPLGLVRAAGLTGLPALAAIDPFSTLWKALGRFFADPRLRQLFARYATYCGASPFQAPATLMLVAHVEQEGVWTVTGGISALARAVAALAAGHGATLLTGAPVAEILVAHGRACGVRLADGDVIAADRVVLNADHAALAAGLFGAGPSRATPPTRSRSLSAVTWSILGVASGAELLRHNVFFSGDYPAEFADIDAKKLPSNPTIYVCAQDRADTAEAPQTPERLFCIMNAPASSEGGRTDSQAATTSMHTAIFHAGGHLACTASQMTAPEDFARLFPATGGALYGPATHGAMASFRRPGARTAVPGLYLAGGSVHPGPGVPMATLSGMLAARAVLADLPRGRL